MNNRISPWGLLCLVVQTSVIAADEAAVVTPTGSVFKMILGLFIVLVVIALISWLAKRMLPNATGQNSAIKIIGGVSVGSRERVVVLEVADRWLVVGVAQGQVNAIANLEVGSNQLVASMPSENVNKQTNEEGYRHAGYANPIVKPFSEWLKKSAQNIKAKSNKE